jgi:hypothetical protein
MCEHTLSFVVHGKAEVQKRPKVAFRAFRNKKIPFIYYDPSSMAKKIWKKNFSNALKDNDVNVPVFGSDPLLCKGVHLCIEIYCPRPKMDYCVVRGLPTMKRNPHLFPNKKDLDNILKFYMDAMQEVAYMNDNVITKITCSKDFIVDSELQSMTAPCVVFTMKQECN